MVTYLLLRHECLSSILRIHVKMARWCAVSVFGEQRQEDSWGSLARQLSLIGELQASERSISKEVDDIPKDDAGSCPLASTSTHTHSNIYTY